MLNSRGLLYPAFHKFYNALSSLEKFEKGTNFFDNISCLDNFFSEYRNITFVLQKSIANSVFYDTYEALRDKYLVNEVCKWFVDKRNEVLKQKPFDLEKRITINVYSGGNTFLLSKLTFTIDNDVEYSTIIDSLKTKFNEINPVEVMFSSEFSFYEYGQKDELYDNFISGINHMKMFMSAMKEAINEDCNLCAELEKKIDNLNFYRVPKNMLFIDDYIFYCKKDCFEKGSRVEMGGEIFPTRAPIENLNKIYPTGDQFENFVLMHVVFFQMQNTLLPTCYVIYEDDTFKILSFGGSIKTTHYRKLNEIANQIESDGIVKVLFVTETYGYDSIDISSLDSRDRIKHANKESLSFFMVDKDLATKAVGIDKKKINDWGYISSVMSEMGSIKGYVGLLNPILREFERLNHSR